MVSSVQRPARPYPTAQVSWLVSVLMPLVALAWAGVASLLVLAATEHRAVVAVCAGACLPLLVALTAVIVLVVRTPSAASRRPSPAARPRDRD